MKSDSTSLYVVWLGYHRRAEVLAPLLNASTVFLANRFQSKRLRPVDYVIKCVLTARELLRRRPRVMYLQAPPLYAAIPALLFRTPYVIDAHNGLFQSWWGRLPFTRSLIQRAAGLIVHNQEIFRLASASYPNIPIFRIEDPVSYIPPQDAAREANQVLLICSFDDDEPIDVILEVVKKSPDVTFVVTANPGKLPLEQREALLSMSNVQLTGFLPVADYQRLLTSSTAAVVLTTQESTQPCGACEALSSDTPLIVSHTSLTEELFGRWAHLVQNSAGPITRSLRNLDGVPLELSAERDQWNQRVSVGISQLLHHLAAREGPSLAGASAEDDGRGAATLLD